MPSNAPWASVKALLETAYGMLNFLCAGIGGASDP